LWTAPAITISAQPAFTASVITVLRSRKADDRAPRAGPLNPTAPSCEKHHVLEVREPKVGTEELERTGELEPAIDFESFYRQHRRRVFGLAYGLTGSASAAEELTQEGFLAAFRRWDRISRYDDPSAWVRRVVVNRSVSGLRRRLAEARAMTRLHAHPSVTIELEPLDAEFWAAVRALPARQAQVVALHYIDDSSVEDIASALGIATGTVKATLFQARRALAEALGCDSEEGT